MDPAQGGTSQAVRNTIPALIELGVHNEVVTLDDPKAAFLGRDPFTIHALGPDSGPWHYGSRLQPWLMANIGRFDAVVIEGLWLYYSHATAKAFRAFIRSQPLGRRPKLFVMPHGMLDPYFQRDPSRKLKAIRNWFYWKLIEAKVINSADGLLFTCEQELRLAREPFSPYHPKQELNVGLGIEEPPAFKIEMRNAFNKACPQVQSKPYILFLSRIHEKKGVDLLVHSYAKSFSSSSPKLVIAGPGIESQYGQYIKKLIDEYKLHENVFFPGMVAGDSKWGAFYGCEAFSLPSHQENFGIAVVEALACGKPVLISNQVNIWREIESAGGGIVGDNTLQGTLESLERWFRLSADNKLIMTKRARAAYENNFSIGPAAQRILNAIR